MKKAKHITWIFCILITSCVSAQQREATDTEVLLELYLPKGYTPSDERVFEGYQTEREVLIGCAQQLRKDLRPNNQMLRSRPYMKFVKFGTPIPIRRFTPDLTYQGRPYYYFVPLTHSKAGLSAAYFYFKFYDKENNKYYFSWGEFHQYGSLENPIHLLSAAEAKAYIEYRFGLKVNKTPIAVYYRFKDFSINQSSWFWYTYSEEGFMYNGRKVHSLFINPLAGVKDVNRFSWEEIETEKSCKVANVFVVNRAYTLEEEVMNLFELDKRQNENIDIQYSQEEGDYLYIPYVRIHPLK